MRTNDIVDVRDVAKSSDVVFDNAAIGMALVALDGRYLRANPAFCDFLGRSEEDLLGMTWQSVTHPDDVEPGERGVAKTVAGEESTFRLAKRYLHREGHLVWGLLSMSLIRSDHGEPLCLFTQVVDVTEQRKAHIELSRLAVIVESSDDAILSKSVDGTILSWNRAAENVYGYTAAEMIGQSIFTIVPSDRVHEVREFLETLRGGRSVTNRETVTVRKDGTLLDVSLTISPIRDASGAVVGGSTIARDISEKKRMAAELDATLEVLEDALGEARQAEARSRQLLSDAAHHLRNPVAGIRACAETLLRGTMEVDREHLLATMARETARASRLVDRLLRISRLEQGEPLALVHAELRELCREEVERAQSLAPNLTVALRAGPKCWADLDIAAVREIIGNLLENARRHAVRRIDVAVSPVRALLVVRVADDGPGLPEPLAERALEPFVSLDGKGGSGLGLAIARALARAHSGELVYEDGAFELRFPMPDTEN